MQHENIVSNNISADLQQSWHIPRPTLARNSTTFLETTSNKSGTQSTKSGFLLLTASNLAKVHKQHESKPNNRNNNLRYYLERTNNNQFLHINGKSKLDTDNASVASSTHFTVVNVNTRPQIASRGFCRKHQLSILVISMSILFTVGVLVAILFLEIRARNQPH